MFFILKRRDQYRNYIIQSFPVSNLWKCYAATSLQSRGVGNTGFHLLPEGAHFRSFYLRHKVFKVRNFYSWIYRRRIKRNWFLNFARRLIRLKAERTFFKERFIAWRAIGNKYSIICFPCFQVYTTCYRFKWDEKSHLFCLRLHRDLHLYSAIIMMSENFATVH